MLKSFAGPFVATFFVSIFVLVMQFLWRMIDEIVGKGLDFMVIAELLTYMATTVVPMALPLAVLISSIMTFGNLGENYELIAFKAAGISLYRIMYPLMVVAICITLAAFFFSNNVLPVANLKFYSLLYDVRRQKPELIFKEGIFTNDLEGYSVKVDKIDKETGVMHNVLIYSHQGMNGNYEVTVADSCLMENDPAYNLMELILFNGYRYTDEGMQDPTLRQTFPFRRLKFDKLSVMIELPGTDLKRTDEEGFKSLSLMLNIKQLDYSIDSVQHYLHVRKAQDANGLLSLNYQRGKVNDPYRDSIFLTQTKGMTGNIDSLYRNFDPNEQQQIAQNALQYARDVKQRVQNDEYYYKAQDEVVIKHKIEWHKKFTLSLACLIFFFIGAPLGAIIRKGGLGMPIVVSIFLFIIYYIMSMMGERAAREAVLSPVVGLWLSSFLFLGLGVFLTYKSVTDSEMMSTEVYTDFFKKVTRFFKRKREKDAQAEDRLHGNA